MIKSYISECYGIRMEENKVRQIEEIEALSSIYGDDLDIEDDENYSGF